MYRDLETAVAMEAYLLREISALCTGKEGNGRPVNTMVNPDVYHKVLEKLEGVKDLPKGLKGPLAYQSLWNIAYGVYKRKYVASMMPKERHRYLDHAEELLCYGDGFNTLRRNKAIRVTPGRGKDLAALEVAKRVLHKNRSHNPQRHKPLAHINVEVPGRVMDDWAEFRDQVESIAMTRQQMLSEVFKSDMHLLTTFSHRGQMYHYPIRTTAADPHECLDGGITDGMSEMDFLEHGLRVREEQYTHRMQVKRAAGIL
jgi:hypothetical protein